MTQGDTKSLPLTQELFPLCCPGSLPSFPLCLVLQPFPLRDEKPAQAPQEYGMHLSTGEDLAGNPQILWIKPIEHRAKKKESPEGCSWASEPTLRANQPLEGHFCCMRGRIFHKNQSTAPVPPLEGEMLTQLLKYSRCNWNLHYLLLACKAKGCGRDKETAGVCPPA